MAFEASTRISWSDSAPDKPASAVRAVPSGFQFSCDSDVRAIALDAISNLDAWLSRQSPKSDVLNAHFRFARFEIDRLLGDPAQIEVLVPVTVPPGSPIGSYQSSIH